MSAVSGWLKVTPQRIYCTVLPWSIAVNGERKHGPSKLKREEIGGLLEERS